MTSRFESSIDRQIREATERGDFDNLPGAGKPLPGNNEPLHEDWWLKGYIHREQITGVLPPGLALRKEVETLPEILDRKRTETEVRECVEDLNARILTARRGPVPGPPVLVNLVDVEAAVNRWRERARQN